MSDSHHETENRPLRIGFEKLKLGTTCWFNKSTRESDRQFSSLPGWIHENSLMKLYTNKGDRKQEREAINGRKHGHKSMGVEFKSRDNE